MIDVVAGILWKNGEILIARRGKHKYLAGKWEFPGGKIEKGEMPESALERELMEEFGICTRTQAFFLQYHFSLSFSKRASSRI